MIAVITRPVTLVVRYLVASMGTLSSNESLLAREHEFLTALRTRGSSCDPNYSSANRDRYRKGENVRHFEVGIECATCDGCGIEVDSSDREVARNSGDYSDN